PQATHCGPQRRASLLGSWAIAAASFVDVCARIAVARSHGQRRSTAAPCAGLERQQPHARFPQGALDIAFVRALERTLPLPGAHSAGALHGFVRRGGIYRSRRAWLLAVD